MSPELHRFGTRVVVRSRETGRWLAFDADTWARHEGGLAPGVTLALERAGLTAERPVDGLIPCRHRMALLLPARPALWVPDPLRHGAGGHAWRAIALAPEGLALWRACNETRPLADAARVAGLPLADARALVHAWTAIDLQLVTLRPSPPPPTDPSAWLFVGPPREAGPRTADQADPDGRTALVAWHLGLRDGETHFDRVETTVAHVYALPHPALGGAPYGGRLRDRLRSRGMPVDGPVVEVGCGDGELCRDWRPEAPWLRVDLSPELLRVQAATAPHSASCLADGTRMPLRDGAVPFLLSNEVLADLAAVPAEVDDDEIRGFLQRMQVPPNPPGSWHNLGAWRFVAEIARVLAPGGAACLTEFGAPDEPPTEAVQLDHPEVSIRFDHLVALARALGLEAELVRLDDLLGLDLSVRQLCRPHWEGVRALAAAAGRRLPSRAYGPDTLPLPEPVDGLAWVPATQPGPGPLVTRFWALLLRKPAAAGGARRAPRDPRSPASPRPGRTRGRSRST